MNGPEFCNEKLTKRKFFTPRDMTAVVAAPDALLLQYLKSFLKHIEGKIFLDKL